MHTEEQLSRLLGIRRSCPGLRSILRIAAAVRPAEWQLRHSLSTVRMEAGARGEVADLDCALDLPGQSRQELLQGHDPDPGIPLRGPLVPVLAGRRPLRTGHQLPSRIQAMDSLYTA